MHHNNRRPSIDRANVMPTENVRRPSIATSLRAVEISGLFQKGEKETTLDKCSEDLVIPEQLDLEECLRISSSEPVGQDAGDNNNNCDVFDDCESICIGPPVDIPGISDTFVMDSDLCIDDSRLRTPSPFQTFSSLTRTTKIKRYVDDIQEVNETVPSSKTAHTPLSSPRLGSSIGWRPVMPGYNNKGNTFVLQKQLEANTYDGSLRDSIPIMPTWLAIICFILNIIIPGIGTMVAGLSIICCSQIRGGGDRCGVIWVNFCVMLLQLITTPLFLLGWIWSIFWGISFIAFSDSNLCYHAADETINIQINCEDSGQQNENMATLRYHQRRQSHHESTGSITGTSDVTATVHNQGFVNANELQRQTPDQRIILMQEAPVILTSNNMNFTPDELSVTQSVNNPRQQRMLRRSSNGGCVSSMLLNPTALEQIITRNGMVPSAFRSRNSSTAEEDEELPSCYSKVQGLTRDRWENI